jgi:hypothetical protein
MSPECWKLQPGTLSLIAFSTAIGYNFWVLFLGFAALAGIPHA